jgi:hypothetical protein
MLGYKRKIEAQSLRKLGINLISNTVRALVENFCPPSSDTIKFSTFRNKENLN